jgi:hypothetical protein
MKRRTTRSLVLAALPRKMMKMKKTLSSVGGAA